MYGLGFRVYGSGFKVEGVGFKAQVRGFENDVMHPSTSPMLLNTNIMIPQMRQTCIANSFLPNGFFLLSGCGGSLVSVPHASVVISAPSPMPK